MSSSPLLTITESHGFRALVAAIITIIGVIRSFGRGCRNLARNSQQLAELEAGPKFWARIQRGNVECARRVPVLWYDTFGWREGPTIRGLCPLPLLVVCNSNQSLSRPLAEHRA